MRLKLYSSFLYTTSSLILFVYFVQLTQGAFKDEQYLDTIKCSSNKISLLPNKTLVMKLSRWEDYHRGLSFLNFQCKFQVVAPKGYGIMAIIQKLHLRTKNMQVTSSCRDYIKMEQMDGLETGPICGEVESSDMSESPKGLLGPRFFYDPRGATDVAFKFDESHLEEIQKPFKLELSFTAYSECSSTSLLTRKVRQCSESRMHSCISTDLYCDNVINCGFTESFGRDEAGCSAAESKMDIGHITPTVPKVSETSRAKFGRLGNKDKNEVDDNNYNNNNDDGQHRLGVSVHIFALVSAVSGALVVLLILLIVCCLGRTISRRNLSRAHTQSERTIEINLSHSSVPMQTIRPAPAATMIAKAPSPEDLPPSYEAIFPEPVPVKH